MNNEPSSKNFLINGAETPKGGGNASYSLTVMSRFSTRKNGRVDFKCKISVSVHIALIINPLSISV